MKEFLQHHFNVLHFAYPILVGIGCSRERTKALCQRYERRVHPWLYPKKRQALVV